MSKDVFDGFTVNVFFCEDSYYLAHFAELPNVWAFGTTPPEALIELEATWKLIKEHYQTDGESIPQAFSWKVDEGLFSVPVNVQLYHALKIEAAKTGVSLYTLVARKLAATMNIDTDGLKET